MRYEFKPVEQTEPTDGILNRDEEETERDAWFLFLETHVEKGPYRWMNMIRLYGLMCLMNVFPASSIMQKEDQQDRSLC